MLSQRQNFLKNHFARIRITPKQEGTMEKRDEVLSSVGAQDMGTTEYQVSALDGIENYRENDRLDRDAVFRPVFDTPFFQQRLTTWRWEHQQESPSCSTETRTRRTPLRQHQSLRDQVDLVRC